MEVSPSDAGIAVGVDVRLEGAPLAAPPVQAAATSTPLAAPPVQAATAHGGVHAW